MDAVICRFDVLTVPPPRNGLRFEVEFDGGVRPAFVIAQGGRPHAYLNQCPHRGTQLDWQPGEFFDETGAYLMCATHAALFDPATGECIDGPCRGAYLTLLDVREVDGVVALAPSSGRLLVSSPSDAGMEPQT